MLKFLASVAALAIALPLAAQEAPGPAPARALDRSPDSRGTGPFAPIKETDPTLAAHVVYRPAELSALNGRKLGVLVWGNGGCQADGAGARQHLLQIASHGYLVIAPGGIHSGPGSTPLPPRPRGADGQPVLGVVTTAADVRAGIDWALAENARAGSRYRGRIDPGAIAVAGHSCGGLQALQTGSDPRVKTVIVHNSGVFTDGTNPIAGITVDKTLLKTLHTPVLYVLGGKDDVAWPNGTDDVAKIDHVPVFLADLPVGHGGTFRQPNGGDIGGVAVDWLNWQLRGDATAAKTFKGTDCRLCTDKRWTVVKKKID